MHGQYVSIVCLTSIVEDAGIDSTPASCFMAIAKCFICMKFVAVLLQIRAALGLLSCMSSVIKGMRTCSAIQSHLFFEETYTAGRVHSVQDSMLGRYLAGSSIRHAPKHDDVRPDSRALSIAHRFCC